MSEANKKLKTEVVEESKEEKPRAGMKTREKLLSRVKLESSNTKKEEEPTITEVKPDPAPQPQAQPQP